VFKRWTAFGLLSSHSRLHGSNSYRVPWLFDEESVEVMREFTELKRKLLPYLLETAEHTTATGAPMMRSMAMQFPQDPACRPLDTQYMLGPDVLVAPVFQASGKVEMYLPEGEWVHLIDGERVTGGRFLSPTYGVHSLGAYARAGARAGHPVRGGEVTACARPTGAARRAPAAPPSAPFCPPQFLFGGDWSPEQWDPATWREDIALMRRAKVNTVSLGIFSWSSLEPAEGVYETGWLEEVIDLLTEAGIGFFLATP